MRYLVLAALLLLGGCASSINGCMAKGYKGVVVETDDLAPFLHCSNGWVTPMKDGYITSDGDKAIRSESASRVYLEIRSLR